MNKNRLEAFSDGVMAIIVTIMVLELKIPKTADWQAIVNLKDIFFVYIFSFIFVLIYWNNHHHLMHYVKRVNGKVLWANGFLLFWLSMLPFVTGWMGENHYAPLPVLFFGIVAFMAGLSYYLLSQVLINTHGKDSLLAKAVGKDKKGILSTLLYFIGILLALFWPMVSCAIYVLVAIIWLIPDKRIEGTLLEE